MSRRCDGWDVDFGENVECKKIIGNLNGFEKESISVIEV